MEKNISALVVQVESNLPQQYYFRFATGLRATRYGCGSFGDKYAVNTGVFTKYLLTKIAQKGAAKRCNLDDRRARGGRGRHAYFSDDFKAEAVRLVSTSGRPQVAKR